MEKMGILTCIRSNEVCTGAGCLNAFHDRTDFFKDYPKDVRLGAFMTCNGCASECAKEPEEDAGMLEKADRLVQEGIRKVHVGVCRLKKDKSECERISRICRMLEARGIEVIRGTHRE